MSNTYPYHFRHAFCTRMGKFAVDTVLTQTMRHSSPETNRVYLLGMHEEVLKAMDEANREILRQ